jgi:XrtJ-associated TM-motif-TM protein
MKKVIRMSMHKGVRRALLGMALLAIPALAHAQGGCIDSPENPTAVLALVGSAGALLASARRRYKAGRRSK